MKRFVWLLVLLLFPVVFAAPPSTNPADYFFYDDMNGGSMAASWGTLNLAGYSITNPYPGGTKSIQVNSSGNVNLDNILSSTNFTSAEYAQPHCMAWGQYDTQAPGSNAESGVLLNAWANGIFNRNGAASSNNLTIVNSTAYKTVGPWFEDVWYNVTVCFTSGYAGSGSTTAIALYNGVNYANSTMDRSPIGIVGLHNRLASSGISYFGPFRIWNYTQYGTGGPLAAGVDKVLTITIKDLVTDVNINGFCINATGTNTSQYLCNATGSSISFNTTGTYNITAFNITSGNTTPQWYNVTELNYAFSTDATVTLLTYQGTINLAAYRLFLNTSIDQINATNNKRSNATMTGSLTLLSSVGVQNILVNVTGNYTKNVSCTLSTALSSASCNATGIYDDLFTIGVTNASNGAGVGSFSASMVNSTLGASVTHSTTTGNVTFQTLQGYNYVFSVNATALELLNATLRANASTNLYNFTLRTANTFNFTVYNESTNSLIIQNVSLQIVSGDFAQNYTFTGGNITIPLLTPGEYAITYWIDPDVPRNYYYTLTSQSYNNIKLYIIDEAISNLYLPIVINANTVPVSNVTVQLLRDYIISGNTHAYSIVEMAKTDTNGQAVLRVVPNIVDYKLIITDGTNTLATTPTKFTANTNTYTFNTEGNPTTSLVGYENIAKSLTFDNSTLTYTFTWSDTQNIVSSGCLKVTKFKNGVQTTPLNGCVAGSTGSITHTINDTNGTSYVATASLLTSTTFSTISAGSLSANFVTTFATFGLIGFIIAFIIFLTFVFVGGESGIAGALVAGFIGILIAGAFGFIASSWTAVIVPAAIIIGIIIYKLRG